MHMQGFWMSCRELEHLPCLDGQSKPAAPQKPGLPTTQRLWPQLLTHLSLCIVLTCDTITSVVRREEGDTNEHVGEDAIK
jgi:hypothetical protein